MPLRNIQKRSVPKELLVTLLVCLAAFSLAAYFDLSESLWNFVLTHETHQFDEILLIIIFITFASAAFSFRRYTDLKNEIAERRHVERDRDVFEKIVMTATDAMTFVDRDYRFQAVNDTMVKVWGRQNQDEFIGHHVKDFIGEDLFNNSEKAIYDKCFAGQQVIVQQWYNFEGFSRRFLYFIYNPYFEKDGTVSGAVVVASNLTELKETEEALRKSEVKFRKLFDLANNPTVLLRSRDKTIVDLNDKYFQCFGYSRDESVGKPYFDAGRYRYAEEMENIVRELSESGSVSSMEVTALQKDGTPVDVLLSASTLELGTEEFILVSTQDVTVLKEAEKKIQDSLTEKEVLLKEIHHRVKNNMAVISSLLSLQSNYVDDQKYLTMFRESQDRINAMALVHEQLYRTEDFGHIDVQAYVKSLVEHVQNSQDFNRRVAFKYQVDEIYLDIDNLVPLGLIINEILTNAFKHAFAGTKEPEISLIMEKSEADDVVLTISDNGAGLPDGFDIAQAAGLGLKLVSILTSQINGTMEMASGNGVIFKITFPEKMELARHLTQDG